MKAVIRKINYDTETATFLGKRCCGEFGQPNGYEEQLFFAESGHYFFYGTGGPDSPYAEPKIKAVSKDKAEIWQKENL